MESKIKNNLIFIRLFPGDDLYKNLKFVCKKYEIQTAVVLSGIGQLKNFGLGYFKTRGDYCPNKFSKPHELLNLSGLISRQNKSVSSSRDKYKFHLHAVLGDKDKKAIGGHLIKGIVEITCEIILMKSDIIINRKLEESTGLEGLFLESPSISLGVKRKNAK